MKEVVLFTGGFTALAAFIALIMFVMGVYTLITGRCTLCRERLAGRWARVAGLFLVTPLLAGIITLPIVEPTSPWYAQHLTARIAVPVLAVVVVLCAFAAAWRAHAKTTNC